MRCLPRPLHWVCVVFLTLFSSQLMAHERWVLTPEQILTASLQPKPWIYTHFTTAGTLIIAVALLLVIALVRLDRSGAEELFPGWRLQLGAMSSYAPVVLRFCVAWSLVSSSLALEPRIGNLIMASPTLFAPDLELSLLGPLWRWLGHVELVLGVLFFFGIYTRLCAGMLALLVAFALVLFGSPMLSYAPTLLGVSVFLLCVGGGHWYLPLPVPTAALSLAGWFGRIPAARVQFMLRVLTGINVFYLGVYFKVLQPNLALAIITQYQVPILSMAPDAFVLIMALVEVLAGAFIVLGVLLRPLSIALLCAFFFFAACLTVAETLTSHILFYGVMLTFLFKGSGHWQLPKANDKDAHIIVLGDGVAALKAGKRLERLRGRYSNVRVTLVSRESDYTARALLPEVVGGSIQGTHVVHSIRRLLPNIQVVEGEITRVDSEASRLQIKHRSGRVVVLSYDQLVDCRRIECTIPTVPGLAAQAIAFDTVGSAVLLRQRIGDRLAEAELLPAGIEREHLLHFAVVGSGWASAALAVEISRLLDTAVAGYRGVLRCEILVSLFETQTSDLPEAVQYRDSCLKNRGIVLHALSEIEAVTARGLHLDRGLAKCSTVVTVSLSARRNYAELVSSELAAERAWALTQGLSYRAGRSHLNSWVVYNLGSDSFAVNDSRVWSGVLGRAIARTYRLAELPSLECKLRVFLSWFFGVMFHRNIASVVPESDASFVGAYFQPGDVVIRQGELGDTVYLIRSGSVTVTRHGKQIARLGPGECFGEIATMATGVRTASVVAETALDVTILSKAEVLGLTDDFNLLKQGLYNQARERIKEWPREMD